MKKTLLDIDKTIDFLYSENIISNSLKTLIQAVRRAENNNNDKDDSIYSFMSQTQY